MPWKMLLAMKTPFLERPGVTSCFKIGGCTALENAGKIIVSQPDLNGHVIHNDY